VAVLPFYPQKVSHLKISAIGEDPGTHILSSFRKSESFQPHVLRLQRFLDERFSTDSEGHCWTCDVCYEKEKPFSPLSLDYDDPVISDCSPNRNHHMEEKPSYLERTKVKLELARNVHEKVQMKLCDQDFIIHPNVFNPNIFFGTEFLAKELIKAVSEFNPKQPRVLEIGTGAGYMTILAILNGASGAVCTDINSDALANAAENIRRFGMEDRIQIKFSDVYDKVNTDEKFDIIFWNYPFGHINKPAEELGMLERALMDPFYRSLDRYVAMADKHLNKDGGRLFVGFSTTAGDQQGFEEIAKKYKWSIALRNELKSSTIPAMQMGFYELSRA
jgi:release factor glutamine methyltransferase